MSKPEFVYTIYIKAPTEKIWQALTDSATSAQYWGGSQVRSDWKVGSTVDIVDPAGRVATTGKVIEFDAPRRLSYSWHVVFHEVFSCEGHSKVTFELEPLGEATKLTITHDGFEPGSLVLESTSEGWPMLLSDLKSVLETGSPATPAPKPGDPDPYEAAIEWGLEERKKSIADERR
ncbi:MAG: SRPBCC family protein [Candidatus Hydrogenedentes bacterium]|nr:SRPBCC family protein [Candidatus Hydrogenedentota bacterium]